MHRGYHRCLIGFFFVKQSHTIVLQPALLEPMFASCLKKEAAEEEDGEEEGGEEEEEREEEGGKRKKKEAAGGAG